MYCFQLDFNFRFQIESFSLSAHSHLSADGETCPVGSHTQNKYTLCKLIGIIVTAVAPLLQSNGNQVCRRVIQRGGYSRSAVLLAAILILAENLVSLREAFSRARAYTVAGQRQIKLQFPLRCMALNGKIVWPVLVRALCNSLSTR